jgi:glutathione peroxidase
MILSLVFSFLLPLQISIYSLSYNPGSGGSQSLSSFQGKKMLIVNIATGSPSVTQLAELQSLHGLYSDSLVIIAFPSNSFGNEPRTDSEIQQYCQANYNVGFRLASKSSITGAGMNSIFSWLSDQGQNGLTNGAIFGDFQKFLIDKQGNLIGIYAPGISPMSTQIRNAIEGHE